MVRMRKPGAFTTPLLAALALSAVAPAAVRAEVVKPGEEQGLGLTPGEIPAILKQAKADPYAAPAAPACESIPREIAALDEVLGPDADAPAQKVKTSDQAGDLIGGALKSLIPHRDIIRFVTGANRRDKQRTAAAMAGWSRRGYLKGMEVNLGCAERKAGPTPTIVLGPVEPDPSQVATLSRAPTTEDAAETAAAETPSETPAIQQVAAHTAPAPYRTYGSRALVTVAEPDPVFPRQAAR